MNETLSMRALQVQNVVLRQVIRALVLLLLQPRLNLRDKGEKKRVRSAFISNTVTINFQPVLNDSLEVSTSKNLGMFVTTISFISPV